MKLKLTLTLLLILMVSSSSFAASIKDKVFGSIFVDEITSVYDGDTFRCTIKEWPPIIGERVGIRVDKIDTPEMRDKRPEIKKLAQQAKQFVVERLRSAKTVELRNMRRGKYFRIVADVYYDGQSLSQALLDSGLAKPYHGGTKLEW
ncbi:nuclease homologue [Malonomonas rubra DSM 5091]|uniref:Nuclease homologue n=1 Tax=Malonomonas rubra DSM 5091 TaxID=1122189 RepID=A0A1M6KU66_MALRU|nr:thermonuclease family protein [Malonomonas rubra]SHJ62439.1 nuclease homologue [Malonomonas rubra DSM 5091]